MMTVNARPLSDVLYAFAVARAVPDADTLDEYARRYPQYAQDLTEFAIELLLDTAAVEDEDFADIGEDEDSVSPAVGRAISRFHQIAYELGKTEQARTPDIVPNPLAELDMSRFRAFAMAIHANNTFAIKLRDRLIEPDTLLSRTGFCQKTAEEAGVPLEAMVAHYKAAQTVSRNALYKADQKPVAAKRETFEEAVRGSGLTEEQQRFLLGL
jgi:hypothetical protein